MENGLAFFYNLFKGRTPKAIVSRSDRILPGKGIGNAHRKQHRAAPLVAAAVRVGPDRRIIGRMFAVKRKRELIAAVPSRTAVCYFHTVHAVPEHLIREPIRMRMNNQHFLPEPFKKCFVIESAKVRMLHQPCFVDPVDEIIAVIFGKTQFCAEDHIHPERVALGFAQHHAAQARDLPGKRHGRRQRAGKRTMRRA